MLSTDRPGSEPAPQFRLQFGRMAIQGYWLNSVLLAAGRPANQAKSGQFEWGVALGGSAAGLTVLAFLLRATHIPTTNPAIAQGGGVSNRSPRGPVASESGDRHQPIIAPAIVNNSGMDVKSFAIPRLYPGNETTHTGEP